MLRITAYPALDGWNRSPENSAADNFVLFLLLWVALALAGRDLRRAV